MMRWAAALSVARDLPEAISEVTARARAALGDARAHLVLVFATPEHRSSWSDLPRMLGEGFPGAVQVGCSGGGALGQGREVEGGAALAVAAAHLPGVDIRPFHIAPDEVPDPERSPGFWRDRLGLDSTRAGAVLVLPEPYTCDAQRLVAGLDVSFPAATTIGGLASGASATGDNVLFLGSSMLRDGGVGVIMQGSLAVGTVVAQGCRPIGNPMFVTGRKDQLVTELDGRRAIEIMRELYEGLPPSDQELFQRSLFLGVVMRPGEMSYRGGDFLIRNIVGLDTASGALAVAAELAVGAVVQFHIRDADSSAREVRRQLDSYSIQGPGIPSGALLFSCLGRGTQLYGTPHHDSQVLLRALGEVPLAGFFCNGEIGPVRGRTFVHGFTSAFALFHPTDDARSGSPTATR